VTIENLIAPVNDRLTPTERRIAEAVTEDPSLLAFGTVSDLAGRVGTSPPSIVRFAAKLGFNGFRGLQRQFRDVLSQQLSRPGLRVRHPQGPIARIRPGIERSIRTLFDSLDEQRLATLAAPITRARSVLIISGESSRAGAHALQSGLSMIRPHVTLVEEHSTARDLNCAGPDDAAVVFDFERYRRHSIAAARTLAERGIMLVAITDGPLSPLASLTDRWYGLQIPAIGPFDSSAPAVIVAELIVAQVAKQLGDEARNRIDQLEALWQSSGTFLNYSPRTDSDL